MTTCSSRKPFLLTFWYKPARSIRQLLDLHRGHSYALALAALFGVIQFGRLAPVASEFLLMYFVLCGLGGIASLFLFSWLIVSSGRWFGIEAIQREVRIALALGMLPWIIIFGILSLLLYSGFSAESIVAEGLPVALGIFIYGFYILLFSLKAALRVDLTTAFLCLIVTTALSFFPLALLAQFLASYLDIQTCHVTISQD